jgi:hypothetical protein
LLPTFFKIDIDVPMFFLMIGFLLNLVVGISLLVMCWSAQSSKFGKVLRGVVALKLFWTVGAGAAAILMNVASLQQLPYQIFTMLVFIVILCWSISLSRNI